MQNPIYPLLFQPNLHEVVWGGDKLEKWKHLPQSGKAIGESWEISAVPCSNSIVANGELKGSKLEDVIAVHPNEILGKKVAKQYDGVMPLLIKFIDARRDLSIQVHPDDAMAHRLGYHNGKSEMWYVLSCDAGATLLSGFNRKVTPEEFSQRSADGTIVEVLQRHEVHPGDVFYLPAGCVHAICKGILLTEIQQSSNLTYRIYDYGRPGIDGKPRELHTELAAQAINYSFTHLHAVPYKARVNEPYTIVDSPYFITQIVEATQPVSQNLMARESLVTLSCLKGTARVSFAHYPEAVELAEATSMLIPAALAEFTVEPRDCQEVKLIEAYL